MYGEFEKGNGETTMKLTKEEGRELLQEDLDEWETVESQITYTSRWSIHHEGIFKHVPSNKYYSMCWSVGATEQQDEQAFEYDDPELTEVEPYDKIVKAWRPVKNKKEAVPATPLCCEGGQCKT